MNPPDTQPGQPSVPAPLPPGTQLLGGWPDLKEFMAWADDEPEGFRNWEVLAARLDAGLEQKMAAPLRAEVGRFVVFRKQRNAVNAIMAQAKQFRPFLNHPPADMPEEEKLRQSKQIMDDLSDLLLDIPEPLRSELLQKLTPMREKMAKELAKLPRCNAT